MRYKVVIDRENCIGCAACVAVCPENFEIKDDGKAMPIKPTITEKEYPNNKKAEEVCPVKVIKITKI